MPLKRGYHPITEAVNTFLKNTQSISRKNDMPTYSDTWEVS